ncbi:hypothetical protein AVEN_179717-1 [Araneus ventricosus]|uniref:Uncharacterized protein n=1 Tax=Araneus ventricosus TaxID=182803 RepID=A0A4Y2WR88_ARAVE|nr:hypothetical protein AVEN_193868-1 [Araneus ventricosus]GBL62802.1 hypothetical protein AVEN_220558-1 [Araneus ventricosus]GBO39962.1 hypothetical protein AVEN_132318-1 [Araneus ventricosus]GBO39963.1 hypothetical protein AVEN_179717-1 [Araneus ventricosus]
MVRDDEDNSRAGGSLSILQQHSSGRTFEPPTYDLACNRPTYTANLQWNRASNLESSGHEAETFAPGRIFTNPTLIELRQEIGQYDWLASPRADDVVLCSRACTFH